MSSTTVLDVESTGAESSSQEFSASKAKADFLKGVKAQDRDVLAREAVEQHSNDEPTPIFETEIRNIQDLRTSLGLEPNFDLKSIVDKGATERKIAAEDFKSKFEGRIYSKDFDYETYLNSAEKVWETAMESSNPPTALRVLTEQRQSAIDFLASSGIKDPEGTLHKFELQMVSGLFVDESGSLLTGSVNRIHELWENGFKSPLGFLYRQVKESEDVMKMCEFVGNNPDSMKRLMETFGNFDTTQKSLDAASTIMSIPDDEYLKIHDELSKYRGLFSFFGGSANDFWIGLYRKGGLSSEEKVTLDTALEIERFMGESILYQYGLHEKPEEVFSHAADFDDELVFMQECAGVIVGMGNKGTVFKKNVFGEEMNPIRYSMESAIQVLRNGGDLHPLSVLIRNGFGLSQNDIERLTRFEGYERKKQWVEDMKRKVDRSKDLIADLEDNKIPDYLVWSTTLYGDPDRPSVRGSGLLRDSKNQQMILQVATLLTPLYPDPEQRVKKIAELADNSFRGAYIEGALKKPPLPADIPVSARMFYQGLKSLDLLKDSNIAFSKTWSEFLLEAARRGRTFDTMHMDNMLIDNELIMSWLPQKEQQFWRKFEASSSMGDRELSRSFFKSIDVIDSNSLARLDFFISIPERCPWMSDEKMKYVKYFIFEHPKSFLQNQGDIDFINQIVDLAGNESIDAFKEYEKSIASGNLTPDKRGVFVDYIRSSKDPQPPKDPALKRARGMLGDYLSFDSYLLVREILDSSIGEERLASTGITKKGPEGLAQLESAMRDLVFGLASNSADLSILKNEIFSNFFKSYVGYETSSWGDHDSNNFNEMIASLQNEKNPDLRKTDFPSSGIQEIVRLQRSRDTDVTFTDSFLARYGTLTGNIRTALEMLNHRGSFSEIGRSIISKRDEFVSQLKQDIEKNSDNPKAQAHIQQRIDRLSAVNPADVKSFQTNFETLAQEKAFHDLLMQSVFLYTLKKFPEQRDRMAEVVDKAIPDVDSISSVIDFTEHMTTKEAWASYFTDKNTRRAFQNILDTKEVQDGLSRLLGSGSTKGNTSPIEFVPTRGPLLEFSGHIADACWASKYDNVAESFPNITGIMIQDVSKEVPRLLGSSLLIETRARDGTPLLIIRGLNPQESYINHVDIPDFYNKFTGYVKRLAEIKGGKAAIVIDNHSGGAATNRPLLFNYLEKRKSELTPIPVSSADTTFNGYNISRNTFLL